MGDWSDHEYCNGCPYFNDSGVPEHCKLTYSDERACRYSHDKKETPI